ncbi:hypothetical protein AAG747_15330 [Rapidithrix thailandica]|uniref:Uncharacterized protein n=1 Tax=Rapidithrix thailandica TaxID=413964 RepID=A0AAW9S274_9BACT
MKKKIEIPNLRRGDQAEACRLLGISETIMYLVLTGDRKDYRGIIPLLKKMAEKNREVADYAEELKRR